MLGKWTSSVMFNLKALQLGNIFKKNPKSQSHHGQPPLNWTYHFKYQKLINKTKYIS